MHSSDQPCRQRRLGRIFDSAPSYFLTLCTETRLRVLDNPEVFGCAKAFVAESPERYGVYVHSFVLMPEHVHLIITIAPSSDTTLGQWIKAYKAMTARHRFRWQPGFFDHVLRSDESRSEKWEYIQMNPVRAGLAASPEDWPYAPRFSQFDGFEL